MPAPGTDPGASGARALRPLLLALAIAAAAAAAYAPTFRAGFVWDDHAHVEESPLVRGPLGRIWFSTEASDYWPLTWTSFWLEARLSGGDPAVSHAVNVALHALAALLLWRVLAALRVPGAWLAGLLFAVHPAGVESVAWIVERKNTLSAVPFLGAILAWVRSGEGERRGWAIASAGLFLLALLAKTSVVPLPLVLLGIALHRRGRLDRRDLVRVAPFLALALLFGALTVWFQGENAVRDEAMARGIAERVGGAAWAWAFYLAKAFLPVRLAVAYPPWPVGPGDPLFYAPLALLAVGLPVAWRLVPRRFGRPVAFALGYHAAMVLPVVGLVEMAWFHIAPVSNHLQYLALMGPVALAAGGLAILSRGRWRPAAAAAAAAAAGLLLVSTHRRASAWQDDLTLWRAASRECPQSLFAALSYSDQLGARLSRGDAVAELAAFADRSRDEGSRRMARAFLHAHLRRWEEAAEEAVAADRHRWFLPFQVELGSMLVRAGAAPAAIRVLAPQVERAPRSAHARYWLAAALARSGRAGEAVGVLEEGLRLTPGKRNLREALSLLRGRGGAPP